MRSVLNFARGPGRPAPPNSVNGMWRFQRFVFGLKCTGAGYTQKIWKTAEHARAELGETLPHSNPETDL
jgi:hypothetical protein